MTEKLAPSEKNLETLKWIVDQIIEGADGYVDIIEREHRGIRNQLKDLAQFGLVAVLTCHYSPWTTTGTWPEGAVKTDCIRVWLTEEAHAYLRGEINVQIPCSLDVERYGYFTYTPICKRHGRRHEASEWRKQ